MTVETGIEDAGSYLNTLNDTYPAGGDDLIEGDNHIRGIKNCLLNTFPAITGAVTSTHAELNILDGVTSTAAELNILDGVTATATELNYNDITTLGLAEASKTVTADANGFINVPTGKGLGDANGNEAVVLTTTASAVTYVNVTNAATGNGPTIASAGETNTDLNITSAGTGYTRITGGNSANGVQGCYFNLDTPEALVSSYTTNDTTWHTLNSTTLATALAKTAMLRVELTIVTASGNDTFRVHLQKTGIGGTLPNTTYTAAIARTDNTNHDSNVSYVPVNLDGSYDFDYNLNHTAGGYSASVNIYLVGYYV